MDKTDEQCSRLLRTAHANWLVRWSICGLYSALVLGPAWAMDLPSEMASLLPQRAAELSSERRNIFPLGTHKENLDTFL
jgi:hypothetical protein